ncbi:MAG: hypothetical protein L6R36_005926 [Xanthoria steineri]|nr:MAG: hypothetical protein L6R36_005926 [Xanthoria steineri]
MSTTADGKNRPRFYGYPPIRKGPETPPYAAPHGNNPVLRGLPLAIVTSIATKLNLVGSLLWSNTGFGNLRQIKELDDYEPRYDPTVIKLPIHSTSSKPNEEASNDGSADYQEASNRHYSAAYYTSGYKTGKFTPTQVVTGLLEQISAKKHHSVAFLQIIPEKVLAAAEASTARYKSGHPLGPLDGVPVAVKDEADLDGYEKSFASRIDYTRKNGGTTWCVQKFEDAGAIIVGKTNMHELGLDITNNNPIKGTPVNPYNPSYYTGGSSGGSASAVSSGLIPIAHGVDGGGSIRLPAAWCGLYGLKPTHDRLSILPTVSLAASNGVMGPMASNMTDLELAYRHLATPDPSNPVSSLFNPPSSSSSSSTQHHHPKILGICNPWFSSSTPSVLAACNAALDHYTTTLGYETIPIPLPYLHEGQLAHALTILSEISTGTPASALASLTPANQLLLSVGAQTPAQTFLQAQKMRALLMAHLAFLWTEYPGMLIVTPTTPDPGWAVEGGDRESRYGFSDADKSLRNMRFVWLANFVGAPALSIPVGMVEPEGKKGGGGAGGGKVPVGLMAMGEWGDEEGLMEWGRRGEEWAWKKEEEKVWRAEGWVDAGGWTKG